MSIITPLLQQNEPTSCPMLIHKKSKAYQEISEKITPIAFIGLQKESIAQILRLGARYRVVGFDIHKNTIQELQQHRDPFQKIPKSKFKQKDVVFTDNTKDLKNARLFIVNIDVSIDELKIPDLSNLQRAVAMLASQLPKGAHVVFESSIFPGCIEEVCIPILERISRLELDKDFSVGFSPFQKDYTKARLVSGTSLDLLDLLTQLYSPIYDKGVCIAESIKVAEAAHGVLSIEREVARSLVNELSQSFQQLQISTNAVIETLERLDNHHQNSLFIQNTYDKVQLNGWIGRVKSKKYQPKFLIQARDAQHTIIPNWVKCIEKAVYAKKLRAHKVRVLMLGLGLEKGPNANSNTLSFSLCKALAKKDFKVVVEEYNLDKSTLPSHLNFDIVSQTFEKFDVILLPQQRERYQTTRYEELLKNMHKDTIIVDFLGEKKGLFSEVAYIAI